MSPDQKYGVYMYFDFFILLYLSTAYIMFTVCHSVLPTKHTITFFITENPLPAITTLDLLIK